MAAAGAAPAACPISAPTWLVQAGPGRAGQSTRAVCLPNLEAVAVPARMQQAAERTREDALSLAAVVEDKEAASPAATPQSAATPAAITRLARTPEAVRAAGPAAGRERLAITETTLGRARAVAVADRTPVALAGSGELAELLAAVEAAAAAVRRRAGKADKGHAEKSGSTRTDDEGAQS